jgi:hypothetical protein
MGAPIIRLRPRILRHSGRPPSTEETFDVSHDHCR